MDPEEIWRNYVPCGALQICFIFYNYISGHVTHLNYEHYLKVKSGML